MQAQENYVKTDHCHHLAEHWRDRTSDRQCYKLALQIPELMKQTGTVKKVHRRALYVHTTETLLVNLAHCMRWNLRLIVTRSTSNRNPLPAILDTMQSAGWIAQAIAPQNPRTGIATEVSPLPALADRLDPITPAGIASELKSVIELRDKNGRPVKAAAARALRTLEPPVHRLNKLLRKTAVHLDGREIDAQVKRVFNESWDQGGRWYHDAQNLSKSDRARLFIDCQKVTELDYSAMHARMMYADAGRQYPADADPYTVAGLPRDVGKLVFMQLLYDQNPLAAIKHLKARQNPKLTEAWETYRHRLALWLQDPENRSKPPQRPACLWDGFEPLSPEIDVEKAVAAFLSANGPIAEAFNEPGQALRVQYRDARIAGRIIAHFVRQQIPILPVHDSFIVQEKHAAELAKVMVREYRRETGFDCPVK